MVWCNLHEKEQKADFPVVQWLRFHTLNAGGIDVIPSWEAGMLYEEVCDQKKKRTIGKGCVRICDTYTEKCASQVALVVKNLFPMQGT